MNKEVILKNLNEIQELVNDDKKFKYKSIVNFNCRHIKEELKFVDNSNPSEALECLKHIKKYYIPEPCSAKTYDCFETIKQALIQAEQDKKKLNEIEKLTYLLYSERRKIGQEYVKWCKENNILVSDETNMITWVLAIKLKEWLK